MAGTSKRQITGQDVRELNRTLLEGLTLLKRNSNVFKKSDPIDSMTKAIDDAIAKAQAAFVDGYRVCDVLESRAASVRARQVASYSLAPIFHSGNL